MCSWVTYSNVTRLIQQVCQAFVFCFLLRFDANLGFIRLTMDSLMAFRDFNTLLILTKRLLRS